MNTEITLTPAMIAIVPIVAYFIQIIKGLPYAEKIHPFLPIVSVLCGISGAHLFSIPNPIVAGILIGMAATSSYEQFKATVKPQENTNGKRI